MSFIDTGGAAVAQPFNFIAIAAIVLGGAMLARRRGVLDERGMMAAVACATCAIVSAVAAALFFLTGMIDPLHVGPLLLLASAAGGASRLLRATRPSTVGATSHSLTAVAAGLLLALIPPTLYGLSSGITAPALGAAAGCALTLALRGWDRHLAGLLGAIGIVALLAGAPLPLDWHVGVLLALPCFALLPAPHKPRRLQPTWRSYEPTWRLITARLDLDNGETATVEAEHPIPETDLSELAELAGTSAATLAGSLRASFDAQRGSGELVVATGTIRVTGVPSVPAGRRAAVLAERASDLSDWEHRPDADAATPSLSALARQAREHLAVGLVDGLREPAAAVRWLAAAGCDLPVFIQADGVALARYDGEIVQGTWVVRAGHLVLFLGSRAVTVDTGVDVASSRRVLVVDAGYELADHYKTLSWVRRHRIPPAERGEVVYVLDASWRWWDSETMLDAGYSLVVVLRGQAEARVWTPGAQSSSRAGVQHDDRILEVSPDFGELHELPLT